MLAALVMAIALAMPAPFHAVLPDVPAVMNPIEPRGNRKARRRAKALAR